jgi:lipid-binding SYLF domain-containing protein
MKEPSMNPWTRRSFLAAAGCALAACNTNPAGQVESPRAQIDRDVDAALAELYSTVPGAQELGARAQGILVIPNIRKVGFFASGAYGEGALLIGPAKVDYYSLSAAGVGLTFGAAEFSQALFFMTPQALQDFRLADGWELGVDAAVVVKQDGAAAGLTSTQINRPITEVVFSQRGLIADASLAGAKYSRIIR